jgi:hypothetical protein
MNGHWASLLATETDSNKRLHFANAKYTDPIVHSACLYPCTVDDSKRIVHLHLHEEQGGVLGIESRAVS